MGAPAARGIERTHRAPAAPPPPPAETPAGGAAARSRGLPQAPAPAPPSAARTPGVLSSSSSGGARRGSGGGDGGGEARRRLETRGFSLLRLSLSLLSRLLSLRCLAVAPLASLWGFCQARIAEAGPACKRRRGDVPVTGLWAPPGCRPRRAGSATRRA